MTAQLATELIDPKWQKKALDAVLSSLKAENLMLPEKVLSLIPPRPFGFDRHRELFNNRTGITFDAMAPAEAAADMSAALLLQPERAARLVEYNARDSKQPSLNYVLDRLIDASFKMPAKTPYQDAVQMTINDVVLTNLFKLASNKKATAAVKATAFFKLQQLDNYLSKRMKTDASESWSAHYAYLARQINTFRESPEKFDLPELLAAPPGQPIGMMSDEDDY